MRDKDQLIKHANIMLIATVLAGLFNWGYHFAMVRMLGPDNYGILFPLFALFMIVSLSAGPIQTVIAKYISSFRALNQTGKISYLLFRTLRRLSLYLGFFLIIYFLSSKLIAEVLKVPMLMPVIIVGVLLFFGLLFPVGFGAFQGLERFTELGSVQVLSGFLRISFGVLLVWLGLGVNGALLGSLVSSFFIMGLALWFLKDIWRFRPYDTEIVRSDIYKYFVPVAIAYTCFAIIAYIDPIVVRICFGEKSLEVGYYSVVSMIGKAFLFLPMSLTTAMFPKVSGQHELGRETGFLLMKGLLYSSAICLVGIAICILFPKVIIYILMNRVDITQDALATMIPLFRLIGFAVSPYGLTCIVINYHLARHKYDFLPLLILGTILQITLFVLFHHTLIQILTVLIIAGFFIFISCFIQPRFVIDKVMRRR